MQCAFCKKEGLQTSDTRYLPAELSGFRWMVRRMRECLNPKCHRRYSTYELLAEDVDYMDRQLKTVRRFRELLDTSDTEAPAAPSRIPLRKS